MNFKQGTHGLPQSDPMVQIRNILIEDQIMTSLRKIFYYMERSKASVFQDLDTFATTLAHQFQDLFFSVSWELSLHVSCAALEWISLMLCSSNNIIIFSY